MHSRLQRRRGLVLEGGGGKGAYQLGCLVALREAAIQFDVVAGTSVGALNAAAWSAGRLDAARGFWLGVSPGKVLAWRRPVSIWAPLQTIYALAFWPRIAVEEEYQVASGYPRTKTYMLDAWALVLAWIVTVVALGWLGMGVRGTVFMLLVWAMLSVVIIGRPILLWLFKRLRPSLFSTRALEAAIEGVLGSGSLAVPTYVTLARRVRWFDPDKPNVLLSRSVRVIGFPIGEAFIPRYERIDGRPMEDVYRLLLGSASLPEGVFPPLRIDGVEYVDGGAADNTPVFPLIETDPCDEVWILGLRPSEYTKQSMSKGYLRAWKAIERRLRLCAVGVDACKELFHQYVPEHGLYTAYTLPRRRGSLVPEREPMHWPHRIIEITPRTQLGGFFSGTLNFRKNYAEQLFLLGYSDGRDAVTKYLGSGRE